VFIASLKGFAGKKKIGMLKVENRNMVTVFKLTVSNWGTMVTIW
jgi:hypothetical protein